QMISLTSLLTGIFVSHKLNYGGSGKRQKSADIEMEESRPMATNTFLTDIKTLRDRARQHIEKGALTQSYGADVQTVIKLLNEALATEIVCVLRYRRHYFMASGIHAQSVAQEFMEHANEEQNHADRIAERIVQLGGEPDLSPEGLATRSHSE